MLIRGGADGGGEVAVDGLGGEIRPLRESGRVVADRGNSGMKKSPTRCGRVGCLTAPLGESSRVSDRESVVAAVPGRDGVREMSIRVTGLVFP